MDNSGQTVGYCRLTCSVPSVRAPVVRCVPPYISDRSEINWPETPLNSAGTGPLPLATDGCTSLRTLLVLGTLDHSVQFGP